MSGNEVFIDLYVEEISRGYHIYGIGRGGAKKFLGEHLPWFALYIPIGEKEYIDKALEVIRNTPHVVDVEAINIRERTPLLPIFEFRHVPVTSHVMLKIYADKKEHVPQLALSLKKAIHDSYAGVYNIVYPIRVSFDLDIKYFHPACPIIFRRNDELEALSMEVIERNKDLKIMSFDIEVATSPGRFPKPGDPIISIQYGVTRLDDVNFSDPSWVKDNIHYLIAENEFESQALVEDFLDILRKEKPDILVGYNSAAFDLKYMRPFLRNPSITLPDFHHIYLSDIVVPHIDLMEARDRMGSSLGLRSLRARALEDVVKELVKGSPFEWVLNSRYMLAEERLDHTKIVEEWRRGTQLFYDYITADAYFTLLVAYLWMYTFVLLSALVQVPITQLTRMNTGQIAEYNIVHWLEKLGFETVILERDKEFRKVTKLGKFEKYLDEEHQELFKKGKVYVKTYGVVEHVVEGDFAQLYPTLMSNETLDPLAFRAQSIISKNDIKSVEYADPIFTSNNNVVMKRFPVILGAKVKKSADYMEPEGLYYVLSVYGPISFLLYKMFLMRRITKKLKKKAKKEERPELIAPDQAVKILNNSSYGAFSKRRGFINPVMSAYIFWKTLKILYDVIKYAEEKLGLNVLYGDTDSVFLECRVDEARKMFPDSKTDNEACSKWFEKYILPKLNEYVKKKYGKEFEIEFDAAFDVCIYPKLKKGSGASKKSYICGNYDENGRLKVEIFKGDFFKALAPDGIKEKLAEFYEEIIERKPKDDHDVEKIMREFLEKQPPHKYFVKKIIDTFKSEKQSEKEEKRYVVKLKKLNKNFHYAALHIAYAWGLPGVQVINKSSKGSIRYVKYHVDADQVFTSGDIVVYFLPGSEPQEFTVYIDYDDKKDMVKVHRVYVRTVTITRTTESKDVVRETGYTVEEKYVEEWVPRTKLLIDAVKSMRKYIIDDVTKKLLPALHKTYGGHLDVFFNNKETTKNNG